MISVDAIIGIDPTTGVLMSDTNPIRLQYCPFLERASQGPVFKVTAIKQSIIKAVIDSHVSACRLSLDVVQFAPKRSAGWLVWFASSVVCYSNKGQTRLNG